ncbi:MAG: ribonuclease P protein component [Alphaproteobacteria bacterium]|nr:ribonuclease P protein component [Alphaproteobacteria bacterium]
MAAKSSRPDDRPREKGLPMDRLKTRADFLRAQRGVRRVTPGLTLEICPGPKENGIRVSFTASSKMGNAVVRNSCKRRLRAAAAEVLPLSGQRGTDYVLVARKDTPTRPFDQLKADLAQAVRAAHLRLKPSGDER